MSPTPSQDDNDVRIDRCGVCHSILAPDQRYCVECGTRRAALPASDADRLALGDSATGATGAAAPDDRGGGRVRGRVGDRLAALDDTPVPAPRAAAIAVMAMMAFGVLVGSLVSSQGIGSLAAFVSLPARTAAAVATTPTTPTTTLVAANTSPARTVPAVTSSSTPAQTAPPASTSASTPSSSSTSSTSTTSTTSTTSSTSTTTSSTTSSSTSTTPSNNLLGLPPIRHVFVVMLDGEGFSQTFATAADDPYLAATLRDQGELVEDYYGVAGSPLANEIALISGQGPTQQTLADCPEFADVTPGTVAAPYAQVLGQGCVYPAGTLTVAGQLARAGDSWRAYIQGMGQSAAGVQAACRHPQIGAADPDQTALPGDPYATPTNPFVYFRSVISRRSCARDDVALPRLATDLKRLKTTPSLSYIAPDACDSGSAAPCTSGAPAGMGPADAFLKSVVPEIEASAAYRQDGLIAITFDEAPQSGPFADSGSCCDQPASFPNLTGPPSTSTTSTTATTTATTTLTTTAAPAGATTTTTLTTTAAPAGTSSTSATQTTSSPSATQTTSSTSASPTSTTSTTSTTGTLTSGCSTVVAGSTTTASTTSSTTPSTCTSTPGNPPGGGQVGILLISRYVKPDTLNDISTYNHFSLLKTIEELFSLSSLGYADDPAVPAFDAAVWDAR